MDRYHAVPAATAASAAKVVGSERKLTRALLPSAITIGFQRETSRTTSHRQQILCTCANSINHAHIAFPFTRKVYIPSPVVLSWPYVRRYGPPDYTTPGSHNICIELPPISCQANEVNRLQRCKISIKTVLTSIARWSEVSQVLDSDSV